MCIHTPHTTNWLESISSSTLCDGSHWPQFSPQVAMLVPLCCHPWGPKSSCSLITRLQKLHLIYQRPNMLLRSHCACVCPSKPFIFLLFLSLFPNDGKLALMSVLVVIPRDPECWLSAHKISCVIRHQNSEKLSRKKILFFSSGRSDPRLPHKNTPGTFFCILKFCG